MNLPLFVKRIIFGGSSRMSSTEVSVLDAVRAHLPAEEALVIQEQVREIETVKNNGGHVVTISYRSGARAPRLDGDEFCLAQVRIEEDGKKSSAKVWAYNGRLHSFEFTRRPKKTFSILAVELRPKKAISSAAALDRLEHPNEKEG